MAREQMRVVLMGDLADSANTKGILVKGALVIMVIGGVLHSLVQIILGFFILIFMVPILQGIISKRAMGFQSAVSKTSPNQPPASYPPEQP